MSKKFLAVLLIALSGCVYAPTYTSHTTVVKYTETSSIDTRTDIDIQTNEVKEVVEQKPISSAQQVLADCGSFVLPKAAPEPTAPTEKEYDEANTSEELDHLISKYIKKLRAHINSERSKIEQAHEKWLLSCD